MSSATAHTRQSRWYFGGLASGGAACFTHPLDLLKVTLQTQQVIVYNCFFFWGRRGRKMSGKCATDVTPKKKNRFCARRGKPWTDLSSNGAHSHHYCTRMQCYLQCVAVITERLLSNRNVFVSHWVDFERANRFSVGISTFLCLCDRMWNVFRFTKNSRRPIRIAPFSALFYRFHHLGEQIIGRTANG